MKITLAKALKVKKRLVQKIASISEEIKANNCIIRDGTRYVNVADSLTLRTKCIRSLVILKMSIFKANSNIQSEIFNISEYKGSIKMLQSLDTRQGVCQGEQSWRTSAVENTSYDSELGYEKVQGMIKGLQRTIDDTQDRIEEYNHTTNIEIDGDLVDGSLI